MKCAPNPGQNRMGVFFMKYDWKFKLKCILKYKEGYRNFVLAETNRHNFLNHVRNWVQTYDDLGIEGLKHKRTNKAWTKEERFEIVAQVLSGDSITHVAKLNHINCGQLYQWVTRYRKKGLEGLELRKGRSRQERVSFKHMPPKKKKIKTMSDELKYLKERNEYLEAEVLYLKKLRALELAKTAKLSKAKKQESPLRSKEKRNVD